MQENPSNNLAHFNGDKKRGHLGFYVVFIQEGLTFNATTSLITPTINLLTNF